MTRWIDRLTVMTGSVLGTVLICSLAVQHLHQARLIPIAHAQGNEAANSKTVIINHVKRLDPVQVVEVIEGGKVIPSAEPSPDDLEWFIRKDLPPPRGRQFRVAYKFQADDDWFRDLSLVLRNRTSKTIVYVALLVSFPETKAATGMQGAVSSVVAFGQLPSSAAYTGSGEPIPQGSRRPILLAPGQQMTFSLADDDRNLRPAIEAWQSFSSVSLCVIHFIVYFDDGMQWNEGGYFAPDPDHPGRHIPLEISHFPGPLMGPAAP